MTFRGTADPTQLATMKQALEEHCLEFGIAIDSPLKVDLAGRILFLFQSGVTSLPALQDMLRQDRRM